MAQFFAPPASIGADATQGSTAGRDDVRELTVGEDDGPSRREKDQAHEDLTSGERRRTRYWGIRPRPTCAMVEPLLITVGIILSSLLDFPHFIRLA